MYTGPRKTVSFTEEDIEELGIRFGSDDPMDQLWLEIDENGNGILDRDEVKYACCLLRIYMPAIDRSLSACRSVRCFAKWVESMVRAL